MQDWLTEGNKYPEIIKKVDTAMLVNNSVIYESDNLAEYIVPGKNNNARLFTKAVVITKSEVARYLEENGKTLTYLKDGYAQLNNYDKYIYCAYLHDSTINVVRYDSTQRRFSLSIALKNYMGIDRFINNISFSQDRHLLLIHSSITSRFVVIDTIKNKAYYGNAMNGNGEPFGIGGDYVYVITSEYDIYKVNYKTQALSKIGETLYGRLPNASKITSVFFDASKMEVYISYFDMKEVCLVSNVYKIE